ncbi:aminoglycoside 6'-N-acetyltransferase [Alkalibacillus filiformis]|uniref:Aminoglycoside 6'-N-acetyltransferase n=1 Tax=Alkalibacillus filiformis TaxID=200990 RepID=A0ABU0DPJ6_9BACI|nr:GNAT family N-acetyltransferase [Alkalibacillus filiformis]MDQ0350372.1 aminoglycoside 6'-N-acetyltransferase [Alkalibacillus filiformis]
MNTNSDVLIRKMNEDDYEIMAKWLSTEAVLEFYGDVNSPFDLEKVKEKYEPRIAGEVPVTPYIVELGETPIGYIQKYSLSEEKKVEFGYSSHDQVYGIDQFIGVQNLFNKGIGTKMVRQFIDYFFGNKGANIVILDPEVSNIRAIKCYEKCGFSKVRLIEEGNNWLMECCV